MKMAIEIFGFLVQGIHLSNFGERLPIMERCYQIVLG
jgi:hypothetical protein